MNEKLLSLLGIANKAGALTLGYDAVINSIKKNNAKLVIVANGFSENRYKNILKVSLEHNIKLLKINNDIYNFSCALGKYCGVISIENLGFANKAKFLIENEL